MMRICTTPAVFGAFLGLALVLSGCGGRTELGDDLLDQDSSVEDAGPDGSQDDGSSNDGNPEDVGVDVEDAPTEDSPIEDTGTDAEPPPECPSDCTSNHECQNMCPALTHGRYCCDVPTGTCYAIPGHHCPQSILDAGLD